MWTAIDQQEKNRISFPNSETVIYATKEENEHGILFDHSQHLKKQMQPLKASGKVENEITETIAPCSSTNAYKRSSLTFKDRKSVV